jgi:hypothetical protein
MFWWKRGGYDSTVWKPGGGTAGVTVVLRLETDVDENLADGMK